MHRTLLLSVLALMLGPAASRAQVRSSGLIAPEMVRQLGLERMWFTQLSLDRGRGRVAGIHVHVSSTQAHTVYQIAYAGKRYVFSQRERDAFGKEIGTEGATKKADTKLEELTAELTAAG